MAGLYFHIPFCKTICAYCDFFRTGDLRAMDGTLRAMVAELERERDFISDHEIRTIYFGGGTPSLAEPAALQRLIDCAGSVFDCCGVEEITVEANPDDVTADYVAALRRTDVNRVSLGVQSFDDAELRFMGRRHTAADAVGAVKRLQDAGFGNITVDIIFGVEGFGAEVLGRTLEKTVLLGVQHVSAYHLTLESSSVFGRRLAQGRMHEVDEAVSEAEYAMVERELSAAGFEHYEVSNYAREGFRARHNSSYWHGAQYLGIGPGAHSFNGNVRRWSVQRPADYMVLPRYESERLDEREHFNEYVMTRLRCAEGIDTEYMCRRFGAERFERVMRDAGQWIASGELRYVNGRLSIPTECMLVSDAVIESFFEA